MGGAVSQGPNSLRTNREKDGKEQAAVENNRSSRQQPGALADSVKERNPHRLQLFEKVELRREGSLAAMLHDNGLEEAPETKRLILTSMSNFLFLEQDLQDDSKMKTMLRAFEKEEFEGGETIITEGESGSKLYILEHGEVEIFINGEYIREMGRGTIFGELALLYDAPRSATVRCKKEGGPIVLWSLSRDIFKQIQVESSSSVQTQRARWLINSPDLAILGAIDLSRLVATLHHQHLKAEDPLYRINEASVECILIEKGHAAVFASSEFEQASLQDIDKALGIVRPRAGTQFVGERAAPIAAGVHVCDVTPGCILGIDILRSKAGLPHCWKWSDAGAIVPYSAVAGGDLHCLIFTVEVFERLFGAAQKVFRLEKGLSMRRRESMVDEPMEILFDATMFKVKYVLGSGSFGTVTMAEYRDGSPEPTCYALKSLNKASIVETGQVRHIVDERKLLGSMRSPFILKLFGAYQTPHQLVMVTEVLECGDLWSVLYERNVSGDNNKGLPPDLVIFYTTILVLGLSHIHGKGIAYRDLKPENVMVDNNGYLRIIDFGFGKKIPFSTTEWNGDVKVHAKSFTLCGTPEYLAPEFIFNLGHDSSCDIWALGVLVYEMFMIGTPFASAKQDNVTELFTNIATVKKSGLVLPIELDLNAEPLPARALITSLLQPEPSDRLGVQEGSTSCILDHHFFKKFKIDDVKNGKYVPVYIPTPLTFHESISSLPPVKPYKGDQRIFADF